MKILVTGGAGFIGSNLVDALINAEHEVAVVDDLSNGRRDFVNNKAKFFEVDITDKDKLTNVFDQFAPEAIHHFAAQASVRKSVEDPGFDVSVNTIGTINLLELAVAHKVKKFIFSSTGGAIYGDSAPRPTNESAKEDPVCPYGIDKLFAEKYIKYFAASSKLKIFCLRYANVYGPRQNPKGESGVLAIFSLKMLNGAPVEINGSGEQTRDFVFVKDVVDANLAALESDAEGTYNVGTGVETSINEITQMLKKISSSQSEIKHAPAKSGEQLYSCLSSKKAKEKLGWESKIDIEKGLKRTVNWYREKSD